MRSLMRGIKNVVRWFPIIWRDRDFDWSFLVRIVVAKLEFMAGSTKYWCTENPEKYRDEMLHAAKLLKRHDENNPIDAEQANTAKAEIAKALQRFDHWWD